MSTPDKATPSPTVAAAQIAVRRAATSSDFSNNVTTHLRAMSCAAKTGVNVLVFPELSLTGYELDLLADLAFTLDDTRLNPLGEAAARLGLTALIGAPLVNTDGKPLIGSIILHPDGSRSAYAKQHLHSSECGAAAPGPKGARTLTIGAAVCAPAICFDTEHSAHAVAAREAGATVYLAGVLWSESAYPRDAATLASRARDHHFLVVLANHGAPSGGYQSAGRSALWAPDGSLLACAPASGNTLVIATPRAAGWSGTVISVDQAN